MYKLVILIETPEDLTFDDRWPEFLHLAEQIPGLRRETTSRVDHVVYGKGGFSLIHELYFDSAQALREGMASPVGQKAGLVLQEMTGGRVTLLIADHKQDELENIHMYQKAHGEGDAEADVN
jgi:uncharacterized protein (TIGR02118 family)